MTKMLPMAVRKENLAVAFSIVGGIPPKNFDLDKICSNNRTTKPTCGTIGCTFGWLSMHPYFTAQGLFLSQGQVYLKLANGEEMYQEDAAEYLFGKEAWDKYFTPYGSGLWDNHLGRKWGSVTKQEHKDLALARLKRGYKRIH
jgi:hypothetical protein